MKKFLLLSMLALPITLPIAWADEKSHPDHDKDDGGEHSEHEHEIKAPNGGRILHEIVPHVEFFITKERKVQITFVNGEGQSVEDKATLRAIGGKRSAPTKFTFTKTKHGFLSDETLPEGMKVPILLMFKNAEGKKIPTIKFNVDLHDCPTCEFREYACGCAHGDDEGDDHGDHEGHDHEKKAPSKK
ncbi:MAG: hypothetical protein ACJAVK_000197 [Akkermansiaceae bacterium]|jgi:hypothetical protein